MEAVKILDIKSDGLNMALDDNSLYVRCGRVIHKYNLSDMKMAASNEVFKKDGKSRNLAVSDNYIALYDFCELYVLNKDDLRVVYNIRLGENQSSDITAVHCDAAKAFVSIRNGSMAVVDIITQNVEKYKFSDKSAWDFAIADKYLYVGTTGGELFRINKLDMRITNDIQLCKPNVHSVLPCDDVLYTMSRDKILRVLKTVDFETVHMVKKAASTSARLLGAHKDYLVMADWSSILLWDRNTLQLCETFKFPTGYLISGALLVNGILYGSDYQNVYKLNL